MAGRAVLEVEGRAEAPLVPPILRGRPHLPGGQTSFAPPTLAPPRTDFPLLVRAAGGDGRCDPEAWAAAARPLLERTLPEVGAILLRGMPLGDPHAFSRFYHGLGLADVPYEGFATRREVAPGVFTPNTVRPHDSLTLHNDMSPEYTMPEHVFLFCEDPGPPDAGGETLVARNAEWRSVLDPGLIERFARRGVAFCRHIPNRRRGRRTVPGWSSPRTAGA